MRQFATLLSALAVGVTVFSFAVLSPAKADDSAVSGVGGAIQMLSPSQTHIRMMSEEVHIWLGDTKPHDGGFVDDRVEAHFVFHNYGAATTVTMGFPEEGYGLFALNSPPHKHSYWSAKYSDFTAFDSYVDGRKVRVKRVVESESEQDEEYSIWWTKHVYFARGQTRVVDCDYRGGGGGQSTGMDWFTYILASGAAWHGTIGRARIICDISGMHEFDPVHVETLAESNDADSSGVTLSSAALARYNKHPYRRVGNLLVWDYHNLKPTALNNITIDYVEAFNNVTVNGKSCGGDPRDGSNDSGFTGQRIGLARLYGQDVWLEARVAASWLGALTTWQPKTKSVRLTRGKRWAVITLGSAKVRNSQGRPVTLSRPAKTLDGFTMVNLDALARAFGGSTHFVARTDRVDVTLPKT